jgi:hypothetical protein
MDARGNAVTTEGARLRRRESVRFENISTPRTCLLQNRRLRLLTEARMTIFTVLRHLCRRFTGYHKCPLRAEFG